MKKAKNTPEIIGVGIDVSKEKLDVVFRDAETEEHLVVLNTEQGVLKIAKKMKDYQGKVIMESTGRYHFLAAVVLSEQGFDVRVVNPLLPRKYITGRIRKIKTDKADASVLAEVAILEKDLPQPFKASREEVKMRQKMGLLAGIEKEIQRLNGIYKGYQESQALLGLELTDVEVSIKDSVKSLKKSKEQLEKELDVFFAEKQSKNQEILTSIPGVSKMAANIVLQFFDPEYTHPKQWLAYVGLDVSQQQSGKWKGKGRISKRGNSYVRKRLCSAAWGAVMNSVEFRQYFDSLKTTRKYRERLVIIAKKILRIAFALLKKQELYSNNLSLSS